MHLTRSLWPIAWIKSTWVVGVSSMCAVHKAVHHTVCNICNICNVCRPKVPHCPTCRQQFLNTRNVALEKLARQVKSPCTYRKYGCTELYYAFWLGNTKANVSTLYRLDRHLNRILEFALGQVVREVWRHTWRRYTWTYMSICLVVVHLPSAVSRLLQSVSKW